MDPNSCGGRSGEEHDTTPNDERQCRHIQTRCIQILKKAGKRAQKLHLMVDGLMSLQKNSNIYLETFPKKANENIQILLERFHNKK